jgi:hypothetical protein
VLALDDTALARLCIGLTRHPTAAARAALLQRFAAVADPTSDQRRLAQQRRRSRRWRRRRREKVRVYRLPLSDYAVEGLMTQLIASGRLSARAAADQSCFLTALTQLLEQQGARWAEK